MLNMISNHTLDYFHWTCISSWLTSIYITLFHLTILTKTKKSIEIGSDPKTYFLFAFMTMIFHAWKARANYICISSVSAMCLDHDRYLLRNAKSLPACLLSKVRDFGTASSAGVTLLALIGPNSFFGKTDVCLEKLQIQANSAVSERLWGSFLWGNGTWGRGHFLFAIIHILDS